MVSSFDFVLVWQAKFKGFTCGIVFWGGVCFWKAWGGFSSGFWMFYNVPPKEDTSRKLTSPRRYWFGTDRTSLGNDGTSPEIHSFLKSYLQVNTVGGCESFPKYLSKWEAVCLSQKAAPSRQRLGPFAAIFHGPPKAIDSNSKAPKVPLWSLSTFLLPDGKNTAWQFKAPEETTENTKKEPM